MKVTSDVRSAWSVTGGKPPLSPPQQRAEGRQVMGEARKTTRHSSRATRRSPRRQARQKLSRRFQSRLPAPRKLALMHPGARALSLMLLVMCGWLIYLFGTSDLFFVEHLSIAGNHTVPSEDIVRASGAMNYNVFFLQFGDIEGKLRALPGVSDANISYEWPNTLHINVTERRPVFVWESNQKTMWVDEAGQIFLARAALTNTLTIRDLDNQQRNRLAPQLIASAKAIAVALPSLKRLDYTDTKGLSFIDEHGWRILLGQPEQLNAKLAMLRVLTAYLVAQKINAEYIDVRLPERAFYKSK